MPLSPFLRKQNQKGGERMWALVLHCSPDATSAPIENNDPLKFKGHVHH